ncbi:hypothetical protein GCM10011512_04000 [Tersicoccus solisilvae]|uniref:HTH cro/C1-type domain-containing protein n=1 Tax=Tersicoccus solisilvae TaxID=1882339 RepID=A0ABQ1NQJ4_9MICC|nr:helix-turn-helix transcriptional regulator [Tersicoccus solisilvae]GGC80441.1 hypothetical protein GCM10011512_04000 [Tersicoccus solisilvae]
MSISTSFSKKLKEARLARGLTQAELAGDAYTASYISLLESGRRRPTDAIMSELAGRLGVTVDELRSFRQEVTTGTSIASIELEMEARQAWKNYDYDLAADFAARALASSDIEHNLSAWWSLSLLYAECLMVSEKYEPCWEAAQALRHHPVARESVNLAAEAEIIAAAAKQGMGRLPDAVHHARAAVDLLRDHPSANPSTLLEAQCSLIATLAESDQLAEAADVARQIDLQPTARVSAQMRGRGAWTVGNMAFLRGDAQEGVRLHNQAIDLLSPAMGLRQWGRLNKTTADMRITNGAMSEQITEYLERAQFAIDVVGNRSDKLELAMVSARWSLAASKPAEALGQLNPVLAELDTLAPQTAGEAELIHARILELMGRIGESSRALLRAAHSFEAAGAYERATDAFKQYVTLTAPATA